MEWRQGANQTDNRPFFSFTNYAEVKFYNEDAGPTKLFALPKASSVKARVAKVEKDFRD